MYVLLCECAVFFTWGMSMLKGFQRVTQCLLLIRNPGQHHSHPITMYLCALFCLSVVTNYLHTCWLKTAFILLLILWVRNLRKLLLGDFLGSKWDPLGQLGLEDPLPRWHLHSQVQSFSVGWPWSPHGLGFSQHCGLRAVVLRWQLASKNKCSKR